jgi:hypothetical protein
VCGSSLELLRTTVATLISISGAHRSRIHRQYQTYRALAHDLRARLYARSAGANTYSSSHRRSMHAQRGDTGGGSPASAPQTVDSRSSGALDWVGGNLGGKIWRMVSCTLAASVALQRATEGQGAVHVSLLCDVYFELRISYCKVKFLTILPANRLSECCQNAFLTVLLARSSPRLFTSSSWSLGVH